MSAANAKITARATHYATALGMGVKDAHHDYNRFMGEMDDIIAAAGPQEQHDPNQPSAGELRFLDYCEANARLPA